MWSHRFASLSALPDPWYQQLVRGAGHGLAPHVQDARSETMQDSSATHDENSTDPDQITQTRSLRREILEAISKLSALNANGAPVGPVMMTVLRSRDAGFSEVADIIERLLNQGEIYQPSPTTLRLTEADL